MNLSNKVNNNILTIQLPERIDAQNSTEILETIQGIMKKATFETAVFDASELEYIASSGLRIFMTLLKSQPKAIKIINANRDIYDIFDITGLNTILTVERKPREFSIDGLEVIGEGATGRVYRIDEDKIIKVFNKNTNRENIHSEKKNAQAVFLEGIPTAIPYDIVRVEEQDGLIYELINSNSIVDMIKENPERLEELSRRTANFMKEVNSVVPETLELPEQKKFLLDTIEKHREKFSDDDYRMVEAIYKSIPDGESFSHGDFHPGNVLLQNDELMLIDLMTIGKAHPIYDLITFQAGTKGPADTVIERSGSPETIVRTLGIPAKDALKIYNYMIDEYFKDRDDDFKGKAVKYLDILGSARNLAMILSVFTDFNEAMARNFQIKLDGIRELYKEFEPVTF